MTDLATLLPLPLTPVVTLDGDFPVGLVIVDASVGFTRRGNLADPVHMVPMVERIAATHRRLTEALGARLHTLYFLDTHHADIPEPPYPPHGVIGTGEEEIDPLLEDMTRAPQVTPVRKDCINGFVGGIDRRTGRNAVVDWMRSTGVRRLLVVGDCTDICVADFVLTMLSARNHALFAPPDATREETVASILALDIIALVSDCETFDAPGHDRRAAHHVGLWMMASRGATLALDWRS